jgi:hypothetical protein
MTLIDFIIGALVANAMPHLIFGLTKTHFLGLFGYSPKGNIIYGVLQFVICLLLFHFKYGIDSLLDNGVFVGALTVLVLYFIFGKLLVRVYGSPEKTKT